LTLDEAIRTALQQHPRLKRAQEAILAGEARTEQAKSGYYPQVSASGIAKQGLSGASGALGLRGLVTSPLFRDLGTSAAAFQNIYDFGRTAHQVKASRWATVSLEHALEAERAWVTLNVEREYFTVLQQQRLVEVAEKTLAERRLTVRQAAAFYQAQLKSKVDLTLAEVGAAKAELELVQARNLLRTAFAELNHAMGIVGEATYTLTEPTITVGTLPQVGSLLAEGQQQRPELRALEAQIQADQEIVERAKRNRWPKVMGLWSSGWVRFSEYTLGRLMLGAFGIDLPIFTGGRLKNEIVEAEANLAQTQAARDELAQEIRLQVQRAHDDLSSAMEAVRANERLITQAREALRLAQLRYSAQLASFVELTAAEAAAAGAEAEHARSLYGYKIAEAVLQYAAGRRSTP
jgi:outer membrane protein